MIIYCNYNLNLTTFQIVFHQPTSQENVMGFQMNKMSFCYRTGHWFHTCPL